MIMRRQAQSLNLPSRGERGTHIIWQGRILQVCR